ncbi:MAG: hypothetical protein KGI67_14470 [Pseudomonadota bacterium]|nr:hypothetical protein [Pseudomonadota bacterium]
MKIRFRCDPALVDLLPRPLPARAALPQWLHDMPSKAWSEVHGLPVRTVKQCPPFIDAMSYGFVIPLPCDIHVHEGVLSWDWDLPALAVDGHTRSPISFHVAAQATGAPFHPGSSHVVKFNCFWTIELEAGWSLFAMHPVNRFDLPFRLLSGMVDADRFNDIGIFFPALWTDPGFSGVLPKGTPIAQCLAVPRVVPELVCEGFSEERARRYMALSRDVLSTPGIYRKRFRDKRGRSGVE